jgi:hypothetical protein
MKGLMGTTLYLRDNYFYISLNSPVQQYKQVFKVNITYPNEVYVVKYWPIARQRLDKHVPAETDSW